MFFFQPNYEDKVDNVCLFLIRVVGGTHLMSLLSNEINVPSYRSRSPRGTLAMTQSGSSL